MDRRKFLEMSTKVVMGAALFPLGCSSSTGDDNRKNPNLSYSASQNDYFWDSSGKMYEIDRSEHKIYCLESDGTVIWEIGGLGEEAGTLNYPLEMLVGADGRLFVLDSGNGEIDVFDSSSGRHIGIIGEPGDQEHHFGLIRDGVLGLNYYLYLADSLHHQIKIFTTSGDFVKAFGEFGTEEGQLNSPRSLAVDSNGEIHVVDGGNTRVCVFSPEGDYIRSYGSYGLEPGQFISPRDIVIDWDDFSYVADAIACTVQIFDSQGNYVSGYMPTTDDGLQIHPLFLNMRPNGSLQITSVPAYNG